MKISINMFDEMYISNGNYKIALDNNCPYIIIQYYTWHIFSDQENDNFIALVDNLGMLHLRDLVLFS